MSFKLLRVSLLSLACAAQTTGCALSEEDPDALNPNSLPDLLVSPPIPKEERQTTPVTLHTPTNISGTETRSPSPAALLDDEWHSPDAPGVILATANPDASRVTN